MVTWYVRIYDWVIIWRDHKRPWHWKRLQTDGRVNKWEGWGGLVGHLNVPVIPHPVEGKVELPIVAVNRYLPPFRRNRYKEPTLLDQWRFVLVTWNWRARRRMVYARRLTRRWARSPLFTQVYSNVFWLNETSKVYLSLSHAFPPTDMKYCIS